MTPAQQPPIGVFDSGIGGLSILEALQRTMPLEAFVYYSDAGHAPYGERDDAFITRRCIEITEHLLQSERIKALVVACNTATTVAIQALRERFAALPIIGVEPAIKPAIAASQSRHVAVLATERTLRSGKYQALLARLAAQAQVTNVACIGLAAAIEHDDRPRIDALCAHYMAQATTVAAGTPPVDTVVLGCTHYPLVAEVLQRHAPAGIRLVDSAPAVASQTLRRLEELGMCATAMPGRCTSPQPVALRTSGDMRFLQSTASRLLDLTATPDDCGAAGVNAGGAADARPHARPSPTRPGAAAPVRAN